MSPIEGQPRGFKKCQDRLPVALLCSMPALPAFPVLTKGLSSQLRPALSFIVDE